MENSSIHNRHCMHISYCILIYNKCQHTYNVHLYDTNTVHDKLYRQLLILHFDIPAPYNEYFVNSTQIYTITIFVYRYRVQNRLSRNTSLKIGNFDNSPIMFCSSSTYYYSFFDFSHVGGIQVKF